MLGVDNESLSDDSTFRLQLLAVPYSPKHTAEADLFNICDNLAHFIQEVSCGQDFRRCRITSMSERRKAAGQETSKAAFHIEITRLYFRVDKTIVALPSRFGAVLFARNEDSRCHSGVSTKDWPYCLETSVPRDGIGFLQAFVTAIRLSSPTHIIEGPWFVMNLGSDGHLIPQQRSFSASAWGHYGDELLIESLQFATTFAPAIAELSRNESFNRFSNALRLYTNALHLTPSDIALVAFIASLEGLFTCASQELSLRLALGVSWFLGQDQQAREMIFDEVRNLYAERSKVVHGDKITENEEQAAILLAEDIVPRAEELVRRCLKEMLNSHLDKLVAKTDRLDQFYKKLMLGVPREAALKATWKLPPT